MSRKQTEPPAIQDPDSSGTPRLFVYGSLAPGCPNEHVLAEIDGTWQPATVRGELCDEGWGADLGYPGLHPDEQGEEVAGFVLTSDRLPEHWSRLDRFEGEAYERVHVQARLEDGSSVDVFVYALKRLS